MCLLFILQVFSVNGLSKYYIHQIACILPSLADVLPNDISANHPGYACVLANVLEAATWILSDAKFVFSPLGLLDQLCYLQTLRCILLLFLM